MEHNFYRRYVGSFLIVYVGLTLLVGLLAMLPVLERLPSSFSFVIALISAYWPAHLFVKDHGRVPDREEKKRFAIANLLAVTALSVVVMVLIWNLVIPLEERASIKQELMITPFWVFIFAFIIFVGLYYLAIGWAFGWTAKLQLKAVEKAKEKGRD